MFANVFIKLTLERGLEIFDNFSLCVYVYSISSSPDWPGTCYIAKDDPELVMFLPTSAAC